jgi:hypothetical protein
MAQGTVALDEVRVASPCSASWEMMDGDDRVRFCGQCARNVYNLSGMTRNEAQTLVLTHEGRLCIRFFRRADGTMLTRDCPVGLQAAKRRLLAILSVAAGLLLALLAWGAVRLGAARDRDEADDRLRNAQPFRLLLNLVNPVPDPGLPQECMGKLGPPPAPPPPPGPQAPAGN